MLLFPVIVCSRVVCPILRPQLRRDQAPHQRQVPLVDQGRQQYPHIQIKYSLMCILL